MLKKQKKIRMPLGQRVAPARRTKERELSQLAADGGRLTWRIAGWLVCADALRLGTSRSPAKAPAHARGWAMTEF
jgi:hypothetical protein